jgi:hypothetical protein
MRVSRAVTFVRRKQRYSLYGQINRWKGPRNLFSLLPPPQGETKEDDLLEGGGGGGGKRRILVTRGPRAEEQEKTLPRASLVKVGRVMKEVCGGGGGEGVAHPGALLRHTLLHHYGDTLVQSVISTGTLWLYYAHTDPLIP